MKTPLKGNLSVYDTVLCMRYKKNQIKNVNFAFYS